MPAPLYPGDDHNLLGNRTIGDPHPQYFHKEYRGTTVWPGPLSVPCPFVVNEDGVASCGIIFRVESSIDPNWFQVGQTDFSFGSGASPPAGFSVGVNAGLDMVFRIAENNSLAFVIEKNTDSPNRLMWISTQSPTNPKFILGTPSGGNTLYVNTQGGGSSTRAYFEGNLEPSQTNQFDIGAIVTPQWRNAYFTGVVNASGGFSQLGSTSTAIVSNDGINDVFVVDTSAGVVMVAGTARVEGSLDLWDATATKKTAFATNATGELFITPDDDDIYLFDPTKTTAMQFYDDTSSLGCYARGSRDLAWNVNTGRKLYWSINWGTVYAQLTGSEFLVSGPVSTFSSASGSTTSQESIRVQGNSSSGGAGAGFGRIFRFNFETATDNQFNSAADWETTWQTATYTSEDAKTDFKVRNAGTMRTYLTIDGQNDRLNVPRAFYHTGSTLGFFSTTPATKDSAFTQTYSTAGRTANNLTAVALGSYIPTSGGWGFDSSSFVDDVVTQGNANRVDILNIKQVQCAIIDTMQRYGLV